MPYISQKRREELSPNINTPTTAGELNFMLTNIIKKYLQDRGGIGYNTLNSIIGVLSCMQLELYRRLAAPYEDSKIIENGDVFGTM